VSELFSFELKINNIKMYVCWFVCTIRVFSILLWNTKILNQKKNPNIFHNLKSSIIYNRFENIQIQWRRSSPSPPPPPPPPPTHTHTHISPSTFSQTPMLFPENEVKQALILGDGCFVRLNNLVSISAALNYTVL